MTTPATSGTAATNTTGAASRGALANRPAVDPTAMLTSLQASVGEEVVGYESVVRLLAIALIS